MLFSYAGSALFLPALGWGLLLWAVGVGKGPVLGLGVVSLPLISSSHWDVPGLQEPLTATTKQSSLMTTSSSPPSPRVYPMPEQQAGALPASCLKGHTAPV